jgi:alkylhydroperoxidase family enzyme
VLGSAGHLPPEVRQAVAERAGRDAEPDGVADKPVDATLAAYVDRVSFHAYAIADAELADLAGRAFSEDAIFEATVAAALGAGLARLSHADRVLG